MRLFSNPFLITFQVVLTIFCLSSCATQQTPKTAERTGPPPTPALAEPVSETVSEPARVEPVAATPNSVLKLASDMAPVMVPDRTVEVGLHMMSKCPFANKVLAELLPAVRNLGPGVEISVHYIGREEEGELTSLHGSQETEGDKIQLCAHRHGSRDAWMDFVLCQQRDWRKIPDRWQQCAQSAGIDVASMSTCFESAEGRELLRESFAESEEKKATGSPTIFLAGERYKGNRSETAFARAICREFKGVAPKGCANIPMPAVVPVIIIGDERCDQRDCNTSRFEAFIRQTFEGAQIEIHDYSDEKGKALFDLSGAEFIPIAIFGEVVKQEQPGYDRLKRRLMPLGDKGDLYYSLGRSWDPEAEVCTDGVDNTGNGKVDCEDANCMETKACRELVKGRLQVFIMSHCPYSARLLENMEAVLKHFKYKRRNFDLRIEYVGRIVDGEVTSMHGKKEVAENIRQVCAQKYYPDNHKFMKYIVCRAKDYKAENWKRCAKAGIKPAVIKRCAESGEGKKLLIESVELANELGIRGSPNFLLNNKLEMRGRDPDAIIEAYCEENAGVAGCESAAE